MLLLLILVCYLFLTSDEDEEGSTLVSGSEHRRSQSAAAAAAKKSGPARGYNRQVSDGGQETDVSQMSEDEPRLMRSKVSSAHTLLAVMIGDFKFKLVRGCSKGSNGCMNYHCH